MTLGTLTNCTTSHATVAFEELEALADLVNWRLVVDVNAAAHDVSSKSLLLFLEASPLIEMMGTLRFVTMALIAAFMVVVAALAVALLPLCTVVPSVILTANQAILTSFPAPPFTARVKVKVVELVMTPVVRYRDSTPFV